MSLMVDIQKRMGAFFLNVSFETEGGVLGLLGASGSGKSMTLKCIAGIERPDQGRIVLNGITLFDSGQHIDLPPQKRHVGYLFQNYALFPTMTVEQNILCGLHWEKNKRKRREALGEMITLMQLSGLEQRHPNQLSGGQQQRVALARILVNQPALLMLDEPFSALDRHLREQLQVQMEAFLRHFGKETLLVTHDQDEAYHLCTKIAVVDEGKIHALKETTELFRNPGSRQGAILTGVKNIAPSAVKVGDFQVEIPAWGLRLTTAEPVGDGLDTIGIHARALSPIATENRFPITVTGEMREPTGAGIRFCWENQVADTDHLWWRNERGLLGEESIQLGVAPRDILLLYH